MTDMCVQVVSPALTGPKSVLGLRKQLPITPYNSELCTNNLLGKYPTLPDSICFGFDLHLPRIVTSQSPSNSASLLTFHAAFENILERELSTGRYLGPFLYDELFCLLGPFQSSPLSIIPKPDKPGKFRVIQNFSFPLEPSLVYPNPSINSLINSDDFPCTWGTFDTVCTIIWSLPPGSQAATRDVAKAYRTVPLHPSQWPVAMVRLSNGSFCTDTCVSFGMGPSAGIYGHVADAGVDLLRAAGIGPITKWVDDHLFFQIRREYINAYNNYRQFVRQVVGDTSQRNGGRLWYKGTIYGDESFAVHDEDHQFPLRDLSPSSVHDPLESDFTYSFTNIDNVSSSLGIPWESSKDHAFAYIAQYLGFMWNIMDLTVQLLPPKTAKYHKAIEDWRSAEMHVLLDAQRLYGKLLHACLVVPTGRARLTRLEAMLKTCSARPFVPYHSVRHLNEDLDWWFTWLSRPFVSRPIPQPKLPVHINAFSDASTSIGIAIVIDGHWRAWTLCPGWRTTDGQRDIGWAECVGFELLTITILDTRVHEGQRDFWVFCDNQGVVGGWKNSRSRNRETNNVFKWIFDRLDSLDVEVSFHL
jgi:hypothetical protein